MVRFFFLIAMFIFSNCHCQVILKGKWIASYQESYAIYEFSKTKCNYKYYGPNGKVEKATYKYVMEKDSLFMFQLDSKIPINRYSLSKVSDDVIKFDNITLQKYSNNKNVKPIINKPDF